MISGHYGSVRPSTGYLATTMPAPATHDVDDDLFTCTFCWHLSRGPPRVLGRATARLACDACFRGLLDLAVCWACGELVVRGADCVSLGWCFWHRACYGCLFCGDRRVVTAPTVAGLFRGGDGGEEEEQGGREEGMRCDLATKRGREISQVPMCAHCAVGCEADDQSKLAQKALRRVEREDGGLSRIRWEKKEEGKKKGAVKVKAAATVKRVPGKVSRAVEVGSLAC
ncbi:hypothetical protein F4780DRAFT_724357 [Xylariomycetidae sp. FL0641]|nr:hypothetical protein F4780DRAFT_724357 [Xylariomycetidae sp. FL0641]